MKRILLILLAISAMSSTFGQSARLQRANRLYTQLAFAEAIEVYKSIVKNEPDNYYAMLKLASAYRLVNNPDLSVLWYEKALKSGNAEAIHHLHYAQALRQVGRYEDAINAYTTFLQWYPEDKRGIKGIEAARNAQLLMARPSIFEVGGLTLNTSYAEFAPAFHPQGLVFTSDRTSPFKIDHVFPWTSTPYLDNFIAENDGQGGLNSPTLLKKDINSAYHDANATFSPDGQLMAFTRNQYKPGFITGKTAKSQQDGVVKLKIMFAVYNQADGKWSEPYDAPFNNPEYSFAHPAFSADGSTLYFTADMPGGYGGTDIWKVKLLDKFTTERPENLGPGVNTAGQEMFPFIDKTGNLYFASSTHPGLGGLDIFRARFDTEKKAYASAFNLGPPLNSSRDDFGLILSLDNNNGYYASNRPGGKGSDDIYSARLNGVFYELEVYDANTGKKLPDVEVTVIDNQNTSKGQTSEDGRFMYPMKTNSSYRLELKHPMYRDAETTVHTTDVPPGTTLEDKVGMTCDLGAEARGLVLEEKSMLPLKEATVTIKNHITGEELSIVTDKSGAYSFLICPDGDYTVSGSKQGYDSDSYHFSTKGMTEKTDRVQNLILKGGEFVCNVEFNNIYFDLDKADIRADASTDLEVMYTILTGSPTIRVELAAHTDSRASHVYNNDLSNRRARSVVNYLRERGIDGSRIIAKGYGETELKNNCSDGVTCTEEEHQENRRVEFRLIDNKNKLLCKSKDKKK